MNGGIAFVKNVAGVPPLVSEQLGKAVAHGFSDPASGFIEAPGLFAEGGERNVQGVMDGRPGIDQGVVPIEQDGPRSRPLATRPGDRRHVSLPWLSMWRA